MGIRKLDSSNVIPYGNYLVTFLERYNRWRRGDNTLDHPDPIELGCCIDAVVHQMKWHTDFKPMINGGLLRDGQRVLICTNLDKMYIATHFIVNEGFTLDHDLELGDNEHVTEWKYL